LDYREDSGVLYGDQLFMKNLLYALKNLPTEWRPTFFICEKYMDENDSFLIDMSCVATTI
jgi:hypothetical protein